MEVFKLNKKIHENGIIRNLIFSAITIPFIVLGSEFAIMFFLLELISGIINFQCINLQNYNIYRLKRIEKKLEKIEKRRNARESEKYNEISKEIHKALIEKEEIPTIDEIIDRVDTPEKLLQLKSLIEQVKKERKIQEIQGENGIQKVIN